MNRRRFLQSLGLTAAGLSLPGVRRLARADGTVPRRLVVVSTNHGTVHSRWAMNPWGHDDGASWVASLTDLAEDEWSDSLAPLAAHARRMTMIDGLSMISPEYDISGYRHEKGWIHAWTGAPVKLTGSEILSTTPSLDQLVSAQIRRDDRLPSLELVVGNGRDISHAGASMLLPMESDPQKVFDRLFGLSTGTDPLLAAQGSALDFALDEYQALAPKLDARDLAKLDTHFELIRQLESRIVGMSEARCSLTPEELALETASYDERFDTMAELCAAALACDLTRVVTLSLGDLPTADFGWGEDGSGNVHTDFAHVLYSNPDAQDAMTDYTAHHAAQLARLVAALEAIPEGDGTLMDSTLVVWGSELGDGWHGYDRYCVLSLGGDWYFDTGSLVHEPWDRHAVTLLTGLGEIHTAGLPHQHWLVSLANAMGVQTDSVGLAEIDCDGTAIDCSGPLL